MKSSSRTMRGCGCVWAALKERQWEIMAWCGQVTVAFCPALILAGRVELVYTSFGDPVVAAGLSVGRLLWAYHFMQLAIWHPWLNPQSHGRSGQSWRNEHYSNASISLFFLHHSCLHLAEKMAIWHCCLVWKPRHEPQLGNLWIPPWPGHDKKRRNNPCFKAVHVCSLSPVKAGATAAGSVWNVQEVSCTWWFKCGGTSVDFNDNQGNS